METANKIELEGIVCQKCERGNKIDSEFFLPTPAEPFWTSDKTNGPVIDFDSKFFYWIFF